MPSGYAYAKTSEELHHGSRDSPSTLVQQFRVNTLTGTTDVASMVASMQAANELPYPGEALTTFALTSVKATMRARTIDARPAGGPGLFDVTVTWSTRYNWQGDIEAAGLTWRKAIKAKPRTMEVYRSLLDCAAPGTAGDVGGTGVDEGGDPLKVQQPTEDIVLWRLVDSTRETLSTIESTLRGLVGKLNDGAFLSWPVNTLLCVGGELEHDEDEYYVLRLHLSWDQHLHYAQRAEASADLRVKGGSDGRATSVLWMRELDEADFDAIFIQANTAYEADQAQDGDKAFTP